jgi:hypothetical protein
MLGDGAGHEFEGCVKYFLIGLVEVTEMEGKKPSNASITLGVSRAGLTIQFP